MIDLTYGIETGGLAPGEAVGISEYLFYPERLLQFKMLGEIGDLRMSGNKFVVGAFNLFSIEYDFALIGLEKPCNKAKQGALACSRLAGDGDALAFALAEGDRL